VGIGANGSVWVVGCDQVTGGFGIYNRQNNAWRKVPGGATKIAVDRNGNPVIANNSGTIFQGDQNGNWKALPGCARDIGVGANGSLWIVGCNAVPKGFGIYNWTGSSWRSVAGAATAISVMPDGRPAAVNASDEIYIGNGTGSWQQLDGSAKDISVGANGSLWVIGNNVEPNGYGIYQRTANTWKKVPGSALRIAVNPQGLPLVANQVPPVSSGGWKMPWKAGISLGISQSWHYDYYTNQSNALDIPLSAGTPVLAPTNSKVMAFCNAGNNHLAIKLQAEDSQIYSLIHVQATGVSLGRSYKQGEQIGVVAGDKPWNNCAQSTGSHLHFGLPRRDMQIDGQIFKSDSIPPKLTSTNQ
jgi:murein DD-endopeptidase MepM/ murein hydrolase activator NlpD